jgi:hypothetical protein
LSKRVANRGVDEVLFPSGQVSNNVHDGLERVLLFLRVQVRGVIGGERGGELLQFRDGDLPFDEGASLFEGGGDKHGDGSVEEGNTAADFAGERVEVVSGSTTFSAGVRPVLASGETRDRVPQAESRDALEFRIVEVEGSMLGGRTVESTVADAPCGEETGLLLRGHVVP